MYSRDGQRLSNPLQWRFHAAVGRGLGRIVSILAQYALPSECVFARKQRRTGRRPPRVLRTPAYLLLGDPIT